MWNLDKQISIRKEVFVAILLVALRYKNNCAAPPLPESNYKVVSVSKAKYKVSALYEELT